MTSFIEELEWRGLVYQKTPGIEKAFEQGTTLYWGIDPTADSLHLGHFMGIVMFKRALQFGNKVILLAGGGTSLIGDPGGKDEERPIVAKEVIEINKKKIIGQLTNFFTSDKDNSLLQGNGESNVKLVDNAQWLEKVNLLEFLRDAGKYVTVNSMLDKDSVANRITREHGISFAEFSYQLLQAYDFLRLFEEHNCTTQVAGSDQWGNMVQGIELIRKKLDKQAFALSWPLIVNPKTGKKFGKTESGAAIWLDAEKTHPFHFYQFLVNVEDALAPILMKYFSFQTKEEIDTLISIWEGDKASRSLQKALAYEITSMVHGKDLSEQVKKITEILFDKGSEQMTEKDLEFIKRALPNKIVASEKDFIVEDALVELGLVSSKGESKRLVQQNGVHTEFLFHKYFLVKKGRRDYGVVEIKA